MKKMLITIIALTTVVSFGAGQSIPAGSQEAKARADAQAELFRKWGEENKKNLESGKSLFGVDKRWEEREKNENAGTLRGKNAPDFKIDDWGFPKGTFKVISKVSDKECLVMSEYRNSQPMLLRGLDMAKVTDNVTFILQHPVVIRETYTYTSVEGANKTVLVLDCNTGKLADKSEKPESGSVKSAMKPASTTSTGKKGAAAYDDFIDPVRELLVKSWEKNVEDLKRAIVEDTEKARNAKTPAERQKYESYVKDYKQRLEKLVLNDPPFVDIRVLKKNQ